MLGRNHCMYAAAGWAAAWPAAELLGADTSDGTLLLVSTGVAAGAGVIPDLDHPDARPSKHFGLVSKAVSKALASASGGHRLGTHSFLFAAVLAAATYATGFLPDVWARGLTALACSFCASCGVALIGPSLGFRVPPAAALASAVGPAWYAWEHYATLRPLLPAVAAYGVLIHIACDMVTKGGVPVFWPFSRRRFALGLFRVGGPGEAVATAVGVAAFAGGCYLAVGNIR